MYQKMLAFYNWTDEDFVCEFDREMYSFAAGKMYSVPQDQAEHFAKHLTQLYMNTHGMEVYTLVPPSRNYSELYLKALPNQKVAQAFEEIPTNTLEEMAEEEAEAIKPKEKSKPKKAKDENVQPKQ